MKWKAFSALVSVGLVSFCLTCPAKNDETKGVPTKFLILSNFGEYQLRGKHYVDNHIDYFYSSLEGSYYSDRVQYSASYGYVPYQMGKPPIGVFVTLCNDPNDQLGKEIYMFFNLEQTKEWQGIYYSINKQRVMISSEGQNTAWTHNNVIIFVHGVGPRAAEYDQIVASYLAKYPSDLKELTLEQAYELDKEFKLERLQKLENERKTKTNPFAIADIARKQCFDEQVIRRLNGEPDDYCSVAVNFNQSQHERDLTTFISNARQAPLKAGENQKSMLYQFDNRQEKTIDDYINNNEEVKKVMDSIKENEENK